MVNFLNQGLIVPTAGRGQAKTDDKNAKYMDGLGAPPGYSCTLEMGSGSEAVLHCLEVD